MEEYSDYKAFMTKQKLRFQAKSLIAKPIASNPSTQKSLGTFFGSNTYHYVILSLCNCLNQHHLEGRKLGPCCRSTTFKKKATMMDWSTCSDQSTDEDDWTTDTSSMATSSHSFVKEVTVLLLNQ